MRRLTAIILASALALPFAARGDDGTAKDAPAGATSQGRLTLHTRTLFLAQEQAYGGPVAGYPVYQWLELTGYDLGTPGLSVHASVWGSGTLGAGGDPVTGEPASADVNLLFAQYLDPKGHLDARVGRQIVDTGPASGYFGQIDGGWLRLSYGNADLQVYGGHVDRSRFQNYTSADWVVGGRVGLRHFGLVNAGVSWMQARSAGVIARDAAGADLALDLSNHFDVVADAAWDLLGGGALMQARAMLRLRPIDRLTIGVGAAQASPGRLIDQSSIFSVFTLSDYAEARAFVQYAVTPQWVLKVHYARVFFPSSSGAGFGAQGDRYGARITAYPLPRLWATFAVERMPTGDNGYVSLRLSGRWRPLEKFQASLDLLAWLYDSPPLSDPRAGSESLAAQLFGEYQVTKGVYLGVGGELGRTVVSAFDARALIRLVTEFDLGGRS